MKRAEPRDVKLVADCQFDSSDAIAADADGRKAAAADAAADHTDDDDGDTVASAPAKGTSSDRDSQAWAWGLKPPPQKKKKKLKFSGLPKLARVHLAVGGFCERKKCEVVYLDLKPTTDRIPP